MNVFLVEAPHQLLNAIEAKHTLRLTDNEVVVVVSDTSTVDSFRPLVMEGEWDRVRYVEKHGPARFGLHRYFRNHRSIRLRTYCETVESRGLRKRLDAVAAAIGHADSLLVGNYFHDRVRHFINMLPHERLVLLDDGTTTLNVAEARRRYATGDAAQPYKRWTEPLVDAMLGWDLRHAERVTFFTTYDLELPPRDALIHHEYQYLRGHAATLEHSNEVMFLGMPLEWEGASEETYIRQLRRVGDHYAGSDFVYVPHRAETEARLGRLRRELGWTVRRYDVPIEYQLAMRGPLPRVLASFFSSALENCRILFGREMTIEALYFDPELLPAEPEFVRIVYDYFEDRTSDHFRVVRL